jgi:BirA family transcriptional regulator, biotin operon repressor / biotin---[acetyl-CoA-carboxylase] ligase
MFKLVPQILHFESLPSTNEEVAKRAAEGAPEGLCVVAAEQTAGRGRLQRTWVSPKNAGLYFSILLRPEFAQKNWPLITLMSAVAVHDTLLDACALETDIKWPNDILANEKKLCGILAETVETPTGRAVVVGIGINLNKGSFPSELEADATDVETAGNQKPDSEIVLQSLVQSLVRNYQVLQQSDGASRIARAWCERSSYAREKLINVVYGDERLAGITRGLENDGALRLETKTGETKIIRAGDVVAVRASDDEML